MKLLFVMRSAVYARNFEWTLRLLAERGHDVHVVADPHPLPAMSAVLDRLCRDHAGIRRSPLPAFGFDRWTFFGSEMRRALDYLKYLEPEFAGAAKLRARAARTAPAWVLSLLQRPLVGSRGGRWLVSRLLRTCDRVTPVHAEVEAFVNAHDPDLVVVTPLVEPGSPQSVFLRAAHALGRRTALCVYSWDNLTNKGLIHDALDLVAVWNDVMKREAVTLHGVPEAAVTVTGAVPYDHWFGWTSRRTREDFCSQVGLPPDRPYLLYLCSSKFIAPNEATFIRKWIGELRSASPELRQVGVLVRPHPQNAAQWREASLADLAMVSVWPAVGANPSDEDSRADYFDSIIHSAAVVGVNTSAQIESGIVGRDVYTVLADEFRDTQEGTLHFRHLRDADGGLLHVARTMDEHVAQLEEAVRRPRPSGAGSDFVKAFVRPHGLDEAASPRLVRALETTAGLGRKPLDRGPWWGGLLRPLLSRPATRLAGTVRAKRERQAIRIRGREQREAEFGARRDQRRAAKEQAQTERALQKQASAARRAAEREAEAATSVRAYAHYEQARDSLRQMSRAGSTLDPCLTPEETAFVASLAPLWNAAPDDIARLRRLCDVVSGVRAADYDDVPGPLRMRLGRDLHMMLKQVPRWLFVQEPTALGGFGVFKGGLRFNADTLKHFKAMVALQDAGLLGAVRGHAARRLVWEIGGGWGGFAYQFKTVCPNVTYVITGTPELFLVSATYLMTLFPGARTRFYGDCESGGPWHGWEDVDFLFVPERSLSTFHPPRLDLVIDIMALRQMTAERACRHIDRAFELGAPYVYSLLPTERVDEDAARVWGPLERLYWPNPVPPRVESVPPATIADGGPRLESEYTHMAGWRRMRT